MADILVQCPRTGTPISTGLKTEWVVLHSLPRLAMSLRCPVCGQTHKWNPADAWVGAARQPYEPASGVRAACLVGSDDDAEG